MAKLETISKQHITLTADELMVLRHMPIDSVFKIDGIYFEHQKQDEIEVYDTDDRTLGRIERLEIEFNKPYLLK